MENDKFVTVIDEGVVFSNPDLVFGYSAWPSVAKDENGDLLVVYSGCRIQHLSPFGKVIMQRSKDEGKTWSCQSIVIDTPLETGSTGILALPGGKIVIGTGHNSCQLHAEFAENSKYPKVLTNLVKAYLPTVSKEIEEKYIEPALYISNDNGFSFEAPFKFPATAPHGGALLKDGSFIYAGYHFPHHPPVIGKQIEVYKSKDYKNFELLSKVPLNPDAANLFHCEPHIAELSSGRLVIHMRLQEGNVSHKRIFTILQSISDDRGKSFSIPQFTGADGSPPHLMLHSSGTLISTYGRRIPPYGIQMMLSKDNAETWDTNYFIWNRGIDGDLGYPASIELSNCDIFTVYYAKIFGQELTSILWTRWRLPI